MKNRILKTGGSIRLIVSLFYLDSSSVRVSEESILQNMPSSFGFYKFDVNSFLSIIYNTGHINKMR